MTKIVFSTNGTETTGHQLAKNESRCMLYTRGVKLIFTGNHISLMVTFKGLNAILGLYKCNYSLTVKQELGAATG